MCKHVWVRTPGSNEHTYICERCSHKGLLTMEPKFESCGALRYGYDSGYGYKLIVEVDPEIHRLARWLVPNHITLFQPKYAPHITVIRREVPVNLYEWGKHEGRVINFAYETYARHNDTYWWLRVFSDELADIRHELGLSAYGRTAMAPDMQRCYHMTIGNTKFDRR